MIERQKMFHNEELHNLFASPYDTGMIKSKKDENGRGINRAKDR